MSRRNESPGGALGVLAVSLVSVLVLAACRTRLQEQCTGHRLVAAPLARLELIDPPVLDAGGSLVLALRVALAVRDCDVIGDIELAPDFPRPGEGDSTVVVTARVWRGEGGPCGEAALVERQARFVGGLRFEPERRLRVWDGAPGASLAIEATIGDAALDACSRQGNLGAPCGPGCNCQSPYRPAACVAGACSLPCDEDAQCVLPFPTCTGARPGTCGVRSTCAGDGDCRFGHRCVVVAVNSTIRACLPAADPAIGGDCECDAECGFGQVCDRSSGEPTCAIPCGGTQVGKGGRPGGAVGCPDSLQCVDSRCRPR